jgi:archaellum component FlaC
MNSAEMVDLHTDIEAGTAGGTSANVPPEPEVGKGFLKPVPETTFVERVAGGVAALAIVTALIAMIVEQSIIVIFGGILSALVAPYAYYQQTLLTDIRTLKETKRALQSEVNRLEESNTRLAANIDNMTESVNRLEEVDQALQVITAAQGQSVETFRKQVEESKTILKHMQSNLKATVLQNLLTVIFRSDKDRDNTIGEIETEDLLRSIQNTCPGMTIHEDRFREAVQGKPVGAVVSVVENLLRDDVPQDSRIFEIAQ